MEKHFFKIKIYYLNMESQNDFGNQETQSHSHWNMTWSFPSSQALSFRSGHVIRTFVSIRHQNGMTKKKKVNFPKVTR